MQQPPDGSGMEWANWYWKVVRQFVSEQFGVGLSRSSCLNWFRLLVGYKALYDEILKLKWESLNSHTLQTNGTLNYLHRLGFAFKRPKKRLLKADAAKREAFLAEYAALRGEAGRTGGRIFLVPFVCRVWLFKDSHFSFRISS